MRVMLIKKDRIYELILPNKIYGNYYLEDMDQSGKPKSLINIEADNNQWKMISNQDAKILQNDGTILDSVFLEDYRFYNLYISKTKETVLIYSMPIYDTTQVRYKINTPGAFLIGNDNTNHIIYNIPYISKNHAKLTYNNSTWMIESLNPTNLVYVNGTPTLKSALSTSDVVFIAGLKFIIVGDTIMINNPKNLVSCSNLYFEVVTQNNDLKKFNESDNNEEDDELSLYDEKDYFFRAPRFRSSVEEKTIQIDAPPAKEKQEEMPLIYTLGPMLTMGLTSATTGVTTLLNVLNGKQSLSSGLPSLVVAGAMLMSMLLWPNLSKKYQKKQKKKREAKRRQKYSEYIEEKRKNIQTTISTQRQILIENIIPLDDCKNIIVHRKRKLWERKIEHDDFLDLRLGVGAIEALVNVNIPGEHFTLDEDDLRDVLGQVGEESKMMQDVPISVSFVNKNISAIIGNLELTNKFINGLILQTIAFHSYEDLKIVVFTNKDNEDKWKALKILPHCFDNNKTIRFFATNADEYNQVSNYLTEVFFNRKNTDKRENSYKSCPPYYLILTDDFSSIKNLEIINNVLTQTSNYGFSLIINSKRLLGLPNECSLFINIDRNSSGLFENELIANKQQVFVADIDDNLNLEQYAKLIANIPIEMEGSKYQLPNSLGFLEMYNVGKVEQLNSISRWKNNNPISSLQAPVGVNENGDLFRLDIHEKFHGPHGLVAGMTGSGKSEFLISYILSMAVNYSPYEVSFVLIDYKGGGLAGAFENKETGLRLPHIAGTITNLDVNDMKRSLASIDSELKLRQRKFNEAREALNESTIDIYKYQRLYRNGKVKEPISHLIIISDEFAELKAQQPEFMDKLISTARIGRSLGVHLILATQKPSGVVNDQIWSNSKFRVCLKVQDKSDSNDMIKRPDAASLKNVGRFYLQVGYNEFFALGQSAWAGAPYYKMEKRKKKVDNNIDFIDNVGEVIKSIDSVKNTDIAKPIGEELPNIVTYLSDIAKEENISITKLWLDKIPAMIYIDDLVKKYNYQAKKFELNPVIGEYDVPNKQEQHILTLPLSKDGNTIIYGASGSGKELLLSDIIYSTIESHSAEEVNLYIMDFGAETLRMFKDAPQVGDVLISSDSEKIENLFKFLKSIIDKRKKLFLDYNGEYKTYCKNSGKTVPTVIVIINNYEAFTELYEDCSDALIKLTREGTKYGVIFILSTAGANAIRYKLKQNFKQELSLQMNDVSDYTSILGNVNKLYPAKIYGRGLIKIDSVYEFQTAHPYNPDKMNDYIKKLCVDMRKKSKVAAVTVPTLPKKVGVMEVKEKISNLENVPVGIEKNSLKPSLYDFKETSINLITSSTEDEFKLFIPTFIDVISNIPNTQIIVFDAKKIIKGDENKKCSYFNNNFDKAFEQIKKYFDDLMNLVSAENAEENLKNVKDTLIIINNFEDFKSKLSDDNQKKLIEVLEKAKKTTKIFFVLVDIATKLRKFELESWYKNNVLNNNSIWLGNGLADQYLIKMPVVPRFVRDKINLGFGYKIKNGEPVLIKYLCSTELKEEE